MRYSFLKSKEQAGGRLFDRVAPPGKYRGKKKEGKIGKVSLGAGEQGKGARRG